MSKYTPDQLQRMAKSAIADHDRGGTDYMFLTMALSMKTGLDARECHRRIEQLAETGECEE